MSLGMLHIHALTRNALIHLMTHSCTPPACQYNKSMHAICAHTHTDTRTTTHTHSRKHIHIHEHILSLSLISSLAHPVGDGCMGTDVLCGSGNPDKGPFYEVEKHFEMLDLSFYHNFGI